jgi:hypothetical protein
MIKVVDGKVFFEPEPKANCELCDQLRELRPYGPNGENVCLPCAEKDPAALSERMGKALDVKLAEAGVSLNEVTLVDPDPVIAFLQEIISKPEN